MNKIVPVVLLLLLLLANPLWAGDYIIGAGDGLQVSVWGVEDLSVEVTVRPDGKITLPAAGDVVAAGRTPVQLSEHLTKVLENFVKKPVVTVTVSGITNNRVYISGGGAGPAYLDLPGEISLLKLLCQLEGLENADLRRAYIIRSGNKIAADFHSLYVKGDAAKDLILQPEDIVFVPNSELNKVYVTGAVQEAKYIFFREGMTVLDAILEAGGFGEYAKENSVYVVRKDGNKVKLRIKDLMFGKDVAQNVSLKPGDQVVVQESLF
ncbi:MAG: polysaccharide biosynthesis/export family protein [Syntrophotaleaceae bacterium]